MRAYTMVSGLIFALVVLAHLLRLAMEGVRLAADPWFLGSTLLAIGLALWALRLSLPRRGA